MLDNEAKIRETLGLDAASPVKPASPAVERPAQEANFGKALFHGVPWANPPEMKLWNYSTWTTEVLGEEIIDKYFLNAPLIDVGPGPFAEGYILANRVGASLYVGVEPFFADTLETQCERVDERNGAIGTLLDSSPKPMKLITSEHASQFLARVHPEIDAFYPRALGRRDSINFYIEAPQFEKGDYARELGRQIARTIGNGVGVFAWDRRFECGFDMVGQLMREGIPIFRGRYFLDAEQQDVRDYLIVGWTVGEHALNNGWRPYQGERDLTISGYSS